MAIDDESRDATEHLLQEQSVLAQEKAKAERQQLLIGATAQLAITLAREDEVEPLLEARLAGVGSEAADSLPVLTEREQQLLPAAKFVVESIFKAAKTRIPSTYYARKGSWRR